MSAENELKRAITDMDAATEKAGEKYPLVTRAQALAVYLTGWGVVRYWSRLGHTPPCPHTGLLSKEDLIFTLAACYEADISVGALIIDAWVITCTEIRKENVSPETRAEFRSLVLGYGELCRLGYGVPAALKTMLSAELMTHDPDISGFPSGIPYGYA